MIQFEDVQFYYPHQVGQPILHIPVWSIAAQEQVFLHGPSGSGKSTVLKLMSGLLCATHGNISILGQQMQCMSNRARDQFRANHIGHVFQAFNLIPYLSVVENIELASYFGSKKAKVSISRDIEELLVPLNIATKYWSTPVHQLSMGQQQRVAIARALVNKPKLLIADEPTSSLDQHNRDVFMALLMSMAKKHAMTLVVVSHDLSLSHYFNRIESLETINRLSRHLTNNNVNEIDQTEANN